MRTSLAATAAVALALAGCSAGSTASSTSGSGTAGASGSSGSGATSGAGGSSSGSTGSSVVAGQSCSTANAKQCTDANHQAWCSGGVWVIRACPGPGGCAGDTCDRLDETPGSACDALDTGYACDFGYNQLHCDSATHTWQEYCYCGISGCDDHRGTCANGCVSATGSGSTSGTTSSTTTSGTTTSTSSTGTSSTSSTSGSTGSSGSSGSGSTGGQSGELTLDPIGFHSYWAFSWSPVGSNGNIDTTRLYILAFDRPIVCTQLQGGADAGGDVLYLGVDGQGTQLAPGDYGPMTFLSTAPSEAIFIFPADGGSDFVKASAGSLHLDSIDYDAGVRGSVVFSGMPYYGSPSPSPDGGYGGSFDAPYCQL